MILGDLPGIEAAMSNPAALSVVSSLLTLSITQLFLRWRQKDKIKHATSAEANAVADQTQIRQDLMKLVAEQRSEINELRDRLDEKDREIAEIKRELDLCKKTRERIENGEFERAQRMHRVATGERRIEDSGKREE